MRTREAIATDEAALIALYAAAFPDEDLSPLVRRLLAEVLDVVSLAAVIGEECVGHILFTPCAVDGDERRIALLGPLAVAPSWQRRGLGRLLIGDGLARLGRTDLSQVLVLGDPGYYRRFGFRPEKAIRPPYDLPSEWSDAWQSLSLADGTMTPAGILRPPTAWLSRSLWAA